MPRPRPRTNCKHCNRSFKYESSKQRHEQLDCPKRVREAMYVAVESA